VCGTYFHCVVCAVIEAAELLEAEAQQLRDNGADETGWAMLVIVARFLRERATGTRESIDWDAWGLE
jgi:hypothetical protein